MPVSCRCPRRPELCYLLVRRSRHSPATIAIWFVAITTRTRVRRLPWQAHDSGESGIATSRAPVRHMISGPIGALRISAHGCSLPLGCRGRLPQIRANNQSIFNTGNWASKIARFLKRKKERERAGVIRPKKRPARRTKLAAGQISYRKSLVTQMSVRRHKSEF